MPSADTGRLVYRGEQSTRGTLYSVWFEGDLLGYALRRRPRALWAALNRERDPLAIYRPTRAGIGEALFFRDERS